MSKALSWLAAGLLLVAPGCTREDPVADGTATTPDPATEQAALPLVIDPVSGEFDAEPSPNPVDESLLQELTAAVEASPNDPAVRRRLAIALHESKRREESVPHFERAAELGPGVRSLLDLALAYNSVSRTAEAEATYSELLDLSPGHPQALHNLGAIAAKRGELDRAIDYYERSLEADPDYLLAQYHLANALERAERYEDAYRAFERVVNEMEPADASEAALLYDALYHLASLDITMGAHERAAELLALLVAENPQHDSAHYAYGQVLLTLGRLDEAQREFETHMRVLSEQHPQSPVAMGD